MTILPFKFKHLPLLHELLSSQSYIGISNITMKTLPKTGYIVLLNNQPVAAGFLRRVEPCFAQFDTFATSSYFGSQIRHKAINLVIDSLLHDAKTLKLHGIIAFTEDSGILTRAKDMGFHVVNQTLLALPLLPQSK